MHPTLLLVAILTAAVPAQVTVEQKPLTAAKDWTAHLVHESTGGVWYARVTALVAAYGAPEVVVCDDDGRITVLAVYSGKWTARSINPDRQWVAPSLPADVDPRIAGPEMYFAGQGGNVHRVTIEKKAHGRWSLDSIEIGHAAGEEFHTVVAAELTPQWPDSELLVFGISGAVYALRPDAPAGSSSPGSFTMHQMAAIPGRVRDAVVLPVPGETPRIVAVSRSGHVIELRFFGEQLKHRVLARENMGLGRIARRPPIEGAPEVLYVTRDDGVVLRLEQLAGGSFRSEPIFAGPQGPRGVAAGRFHVDPARESVAVYGYGQKVQIVSRVDTGPWEVETVFEGEHRGHWLTVGELDGRNGTDELIATDFGGQVVILSRPPGHGLPGVAVDPGTPEAPTPAAGEPPPATCPRARGKR